MRRVKVTFKDFDIGVAGSDDEEAINLAKDLFFDGLKLIDLLEIATFQVIKEEEDATI